MSCTYIFWKKEKKGTRKTNKKGTHKNDSEKVDQCLPPSAEAVVKEKHTFGNMVWAASAIRPLRCMCLWGNRKGGNRSGGGQSDASSQHTIVNSTPTIVSQNEFTTRIWVNIGRTLHVQQRLPALRTIAAVLARRTKDPTR